MNTNWKALFQRWGQPSTEARIAVRDYLLRPDQLTAKEIKYYDESAEQTIKELEETVAALREYRLALAARYAELSTMPYTLRIELIRERAWKGPVTYYLRLIRVYADGHEEQEWSKDWPGNERHKALKAYREELKSRPGIETRCEIEKSRWEH